MNTRCLLILLLTSLHKTTPFVFTAIGTAVGVVEKIDNLWKLLDEHTDLVDSDNKQKQNLVFSRLDNINMELVDVDERLGSIDQSLSVIVKLLNNLPDQVSLELNLNDIRTKQNFIDVYYKRHNDYAMDFQLYENSTLIEFSNSVVSSNPNSVSYLIEAIYSQVTRDDFLKKLFAQVQPNTEGYFCREMRSAQLALLAFLDEMIFVTTKSYVLEQSSYAIKMLYREGTFKQEVNNSNNLFRARYEGLISAFKPYIARASLQQWRCDPTEHVSNETYVELSFLHGYVLNEANIDAGGGCQDECSTYRYTKTQNCKDNAWCKKQLPCSKIIDCHYVDSAMKVCSSDLLRTKRRYEFVEFNNGRSYGKRKGCRYDKLNHLETYWQYVFVYKCSYCFCLCDEGERFFSERYVNLRLARSDIAKNRVVVGLRFVKVNQIIHLQVQEGKLLADGQIDADTVRWVPVDSYSRTDKNRYEGQDYHTLTWERRGFELHDVKAPANHLVTGVRFRRVGTRIDLEVLVTPFDYASGQLKTRKSYFQDDPNTFIKHKFANELKLHRPDVPTRGGASNFITTDRYVQFTNSDFEKDAAQATVPFFDAQPVEATVPLTGIGVYHRGRSGSGGFLAPRIFTYNYTQHLSPTFSLR